MTYLAQFKIPSDTNNSVNVPVPSGLSAPLQNASLKTTGAAFFQTGYNLLFTLTIALAIIFIMFSGIQMMTSGGDSQKLASARARLIYAIIGLVIVILAFLIVRTIFTLTGSSGQNIF